MEVDSLAGSTRAGVTLDCLSWELDEGLWFAPELHARWIHQFGDTERRLVPVLTGVGEPYAPFIGGAEVGGRDGMVLGIGWGVSSDTGLHAYADWELGWAPDLLQNTVKAGFQFVF